MENGRRDELVDERVVDHQGLDGKPEVDGALEHLALAELLLVDLLWLQRHFEDVEAPWRGVVLRVILREKLLLSSTCSPLLLLPLHRPRTRTRSTLDKLAWDVLRLHVSIPDLDYLDIIFFPRVPDRWG